MRFDGYDAIVVGTGFGSCACALALAEKGLRVLVLERGDWAKRDATDWDSHAILIEKRYRGMSPLLVKQYKDTHFKEMVENEVVGGMSVFYGGASLRLREADFDDWPIVYADLAPFYDMAEKLLEVHGVAGEDPFEPPGIGGYPFAPSDLTVPAQRIKLAGQKLGLKPFRIPMAINFSNAVRTLCIKCLTCDGFPCQIEAKNDLTQTLLKRAIEAGATLVAGVQVVRVKVDGHCVGSVVCVDRQSKKQFEIPAPRVVLGAGALQSPAILLRSELERVSPRDLIGRFLMRHCNAVVAGVFPFYTNPEKVFHKQVCFSDFYEDFRQKEGKAAGVIQDIYTPAPVVLRHFSPLGLKHVAAFAAQFMQNLLCIAEDDPQFDNVVRLSDAKDEHGVSRVQITHRYSRGDQARRDHLVNGAKRILQKAGAWVFHSYLINTFSHAVGTVRMGNDPQHSVVDSDCRFWGIDNLFVVDGSVFPTSGGVNPSLTIAANGLRVGANMAENF